MTQADHRRWLDGRWIRLGATAALVAIVLFVQSGWFMVILGSPDPAEAALRDWIQFHRTAERIVSGRAGEIYPVDFAGDGRPEFTDGFYFMYPPFAARVTLSLAPLSRWGAYLACVLAVAAGTLLGTFGVLRVLRVRTLQRFFAVLGTVASAPWNAAVLLGHLSAWLLPSPSLALKGRTSRRLEKCLDAEEVSSQIRYDLYGRRRPDARRLASRALRQDSPTSSIAREDRTGARSRNGRGSQRRGPRNPCSPGREEPCWATAGRCVAVRHEFFPGGTDL